MEATHVTLEEIDTFRKEWNAKFGNYYDLDSVDGVLALSTAILANIKGKNAYFPPPHTFIHPWKLDGYKRNCLDGKSYFVTQTTAGYDPKVLVERFHHMCKTRKLGITNIEGYLELTKEGRPHYHYIMEVSQSMNRKNFLALNGNERIEVKLIKTKADYDRIYNYITKELNTPEIIQYALEQNVPQNLAYSSPN